MENKEGNEKNAKSAPIEYCSLFKKNVIKRSVFNVIVSDALQDSLIEPLIDLIIEYADEFNGHLRATFDPKCVVYCSVVVNCELIASGLDGGIIVVWNPNKRVVLHVFKQSISVYKLYVLSGGLLVSSDLNLNKIYVWNMNTGKLVRILKIPHKTCRWYALINNICFISDEFIGVYNAETGKHVDTGHFNLDFNDQDTFDETSCRILGFTMIETSKELLLVNDAGKIVHGLNCVVDNIQYSVLCAVSVLGYLVAFCIDEDIEVYNTKTGDTEFFLCEHDNDVLALMELPGGLVSGDKEGNVKIWNMHTRELVHEIKTNNAVHSFHMFNDIIIVCTKNGYIETFNNVTYERGVIFKSIGESDYIINDVISVGNTLVTHSNETGFRIWS